MQALLSLLRARLAAPLPGRAAQERMTGRLRPMPDVIPADAMDSAVLQVLFPLDGELHILLMRRTEDGRAHSGQISFPGGRREAQDASLLMTALREAEEEVGITNGEVEVLGALTPLYIPVSYFMVHPFVAWSAHRPDYLPSRSEVSVIIEAPVAALFHKDSKITTEVRPSSMPEIVLNVPAYRLPDGGIIWGATAMMLSELEEVMTGLL